MGYVTTRPVGLKYTGSTSSISWHLTHSREVVDAVELRLLTTEFNERELMYLGDDIILQLKKDLVCKVQVKDYMDKLIEDLYKVHTVPTAWVYSYDICIYNYDRTTLPNPAAYEPAVNMAASNPAVGWGMADNTVAYGGGGGSTVNHGPL